MTDKMPYEMGTGELQEEIIATKDALKKEKDYLTELENYMSELKIALDDSRRADTQRVKVIALKALAATDYDLKEAEYRITKACISQELPMISVATLYRYRKKLKDLGERENGLPTMDDDWTDFVAEYFPEHRGTTKRGAVVDQIISLLNILNTAQTPVTISDLVDQYRERVGPISESTARRYLTRAVYLSYGAPSLSSAGMSLGIEISIVLPDDPYYDGTYYLIGRSPRLPILFFPVDHRFTTKNVVTFLDFVIGYYTTHARSSTQSVSVHIQSNLVSEKIIQKIRDKYSTVSFHPFEVQ